MNPNLESNSNFQPGWFQEKKLSQKRNFNILIMALIALFLLHWLVLTNSQNKLEITQQNLSKQIETNNERLRNSAGLNQKINSLNDELNQSKIFFTKENTQIIIESLSDLLRVNGAESIEVSLLNNGFGMNNPIIQIDKKFSEFFNQPIQIQMQFRASLREQQEIINQINTSDYLFSLLTTTHQAEVNQNNQQNNQPNLNRFNPSNPNINYSNQPRVIWQVAIVNLKTNDNNQNPQILTKKAIFPKIGNVPIVTPAPVIKKVEISSPGEASCDLPILEGIVYKMEKQNSLVFIAGEIYRINQSIDCYQLIDIFPQSIHLSDRSGKIFELFTQP